MNQQWPGHAPAYRAPMPAEPPSVSAVEALKFAFSSKDWTTNLLIGMVFMFIPIVGPLALQGWHCEITQRLARRHPQPIPKLDFADLGHYLERGVGPFVVNLLIMLPLMFVMYIYIAIVAVSTAAIAEATGEPAAAVAVAGGLMLVGIVASFPVAVLTNAGLTRVELTEQIGWSLSLGAMWRYGGRTWVKYLVSTICFAPLAIGIVLCGALVLCLGLYPASVAVQLAAMHLRWQIYETDVAEGGEAIQVKPPVLLPSEAKHAPAGPPRYY